MTASLPETCVFDRALSGSPSFLLYGSSLPLADLVHRVRRGCGPVEPVDWREAKTQDVLAAEVVARLEKNPLLLVLMGADLGPAARAALSAVLDGQVPMRGGVRPFPGARVVLLASGGTPGPELRSMFGVSMAATAALRPASAAHPMSAAEGAG